MIAHVPAEKAVKDFTAAAAAAVGGGGVGWVGVGGATERSWWRIQNCKHIISMLK